MSSPQPTHPMPPGGFCSPLLHRFNTIDLPKSLKKLSQLPEIIAFAPQILKLIQLLPQIPNSLYNDFLPIRLNSHT